MGKTAREPLTDASGCLTTFNRYASERYTSSNDSVVTIQNTKISTYAASRAPTPDICVVQPAFIRARARDRTQNKSSPFYSTRVYIKLRIRLWSYSTNSWRCRCQNISAPPRTIGITSSLTHTRSSVVRAEVRAAGSFSKPRGARSVC